MKLRGRKRCDKHFAALNFIIIIITTKNNRQKKIVYKVSRMPTILKSCDANDFFLVLSGTRQQKKNGRRKK